MDIVLFQWTKKKVNVLCPIKKTVQVYTYVDCASNLNFITEIHTWVIQKTVKVWILFYSWLV